MCGGVDTDGSGTDQDVQAGSDKRVADANVASAHRNNHSARQVTFHINGLS